MRTASVSMISTFAWVFVVPFAPVAGVAVDLRLRTRTTFGFGNSTGDGSRSSEARSLSEEDSEALDIIAKRGCRNLSL